MTSPVIPDKALLESWLEQAHAEYHKCDRCEGLPFEACVYNCPCNAISRRAPSEVFGAAAPGAGGRG